MKNPINKWREWRWRRRQRQACLLFLTLDRAMTRERWPSWKRRQFWRDVIKHPLARAAAFSAIYTTLGSKPAGK